MIEELPSRTAGLPLHARARAPGALRPADRRAPRGAAPARRRGARERRRALRPRARRPRAPLRRRGAARRRRGAASSTTSSPRGRRPPRSRSTRRRRGCAPRSSCGSTSPRRARGGAARARHRRATAPARRSTRWRRSGRRRRSPASWATPSCSRARRSATRTRAGARGSPTQGAVELLEEAAAALGERELGAARAAARRARPRARLPGRARARRRSSATSAVAMARRLGDRAGLATVLVRAYWSRGTSPLEEILDDAHRGRDIGEELGDTEIRAEAMSWRVPAFVALCDLDAARREIAALRETAERTAQPFMLHVAEHYGSAIALCDGRLEEAEAMARALARVEPAADRPRRLGRLRDPDVQRPPRAGAAGGARAGGPDPGRRATRRSGPWRPGLVCAARRARAWRPRRGASSRGSPPTGSTPFRESLWLASLTYLTDACAALGDEAMAALVYPELEPLAGENVMIGHLVACYGAADRYLGMLAATLGEWERAEEHFERAHGAQPAHGRGDLARPHALRARPRAARARRRRRRRRAARRGGGARRAHRHAGAARPHPGARSPAPAAGRSRTGCRRARCRSSASSPAASATARSAAALSISEHTAANHIRSILRKTGCANRTEAASYAHRHGLVEA